jgi:uncharacterized membrane protein YfcA
MAGTPLAVGVIVLLAAAVQSATGFGYAILAAPLLSTVQALPLVWLTFAPATAVVTLLRRADVCWAIGWRASLAGVPAALIAGWALADAPQRALQALTGLSIPVFTLARPPSGADLARAGDRRACRRDRRRPRGDHRHQRPSPRPCRKLSVVRAPGEAARRSGRN